MGNNTKTKLKACPSCGAMIANDATTCPQCRKRLNIAARWVAIGFVAAVLAVVVYAMMITPAREAGKEADEIYRSMQQHR